MTPHAYPPPAATTVDPCARRHRVMAWIVVVLLAGTVTAGLNVYCAEGRPHQGRAK